MFQPYMAIIRFFPLKVSLYKLRCGDLPSDYNSSMPMYRRVLYYIDISLFTRIISTLSTLCTRIFSVRNSN